ncbi:MAG: Uncharacterized protein JWP80_1869 [Pseudomonas sp.]|nr:Uncharacterized protein [Pseudomonas sp.]
MEKQGIGFNENNFMRTQGTSSLIGDDPNASQAMVIENVLVSVTAGMSARNKEIVMDCVQYATMQSGNARKSVEWYESFTHALTRCGFPSTRSRFGSYRAKESRLTMDKLGLEILASLVASAAVGPLTGPLLLELAAKTFDALKREDKPLRLFQRSSKPWDDISFAIVAGVETPDGDVVLAMAVVTIDVNVSVTNVLFWDFNSSSVKIERGEDVKQLNHRQWRRAEKFVDDYLMSETEAAFEKFSL